MRNQRNLDDISIWLFVCCGMIFIMALLGAVTRLSEAGLSIPSWDPILGIFPPFGHKQWQTAFAAYQEIPQYRLLHGDMSLNSFKVIYYWEWFHRLWGRLIGLVFVIPAMIFWFQGKINRKQGFGLLFIFLLGGLQGFIGWFMVQSGLTIRTAVSPYRLALHLGFALLIYSILLAMALGKRACIPMASGGIRQGWMTMSVLLLTIFIGVFVAGLQAGMVNNTWPTMAGDWFPVGYDAIRPLWLNLFENAALVQFIHRWLGPLTMILVITWVARCWRYGDSSGRLGLAALAMMSVIQVALGLATLLTHVQIVLAVLHQGGAITLLTLLIYNLIRIRRTNRLIQIETTRPHRQNANTMPQPSNQSESLK